MASSSNPDVNSDKERAYLYASNTNVSNFVSVKLSGDQNYHLWKEQMLCLLEAHDMCSLVDDSPAEYDCTLMKKYNSLLRGWIFGSVSEDVLRIVVAHGSAKVVWNELRKYFDPNTSSDQQDSTTTKADTKTETEDKNLVLEETTTNHKGMKSTEPQGKDEAVTQLEIKVDSATPEADREIVTEDKDKNVLLTRKTTTEIGTSSAVSKAKDEVAIPIKTEGSDTGDKVALRKQKTEVKDKDMDPEGKDKTSQVEKKDSNPIKTHAEKLFKAILDGNSREAINKLRKMDSLKVVNAALYKLSRMLNIKDDKFKDVTVQDVIKYNNEKDGNTILHIAVAMAQNDVVSTILEFIDDNELAELKNFESSTALHIAANVGNTDAAKLLVKKNKNLLNIEDKYKKKPLVNSYENMRFETTWFLLNPDADESSKNAANVDENSKKTTNVDESSKKAGTVDQNIKIKSCSRPLTLDDEIGVNTLAQVVSAKQYDVASTFMQEYPKYVVSSDNVLMAIARTFPSGLEYGETFFYPSVYNIESICQRIGLLFAVLGFIVLSPCLSCQYKSKDLCQDLIILFMGVPLMTIYWIYLLILELILVACFPFYMIYCILWKVASLLRVPFIKDIEVRKKEFEKAKKVLKLICDNLNSSDLCTPELYTGPILEAACQDAYDVVDEILDKWPEAWGAKKNGYNIIQLATINRSEKVYNLIHILKKHQNVYSTIEDSCNNNMLHLAGRLAPSNKLKLRTGAALQLQRELQWYQEVKKLVFPTYVTKENMFMETPDMVFTREHENLVKEGENWIKTVAESCSITAALIITIMFAAAITVPGGNSQEGVPVFLNETPFTIFAFSVAISLFSSVTALLVFLSILTARFAEEDFVSRLPRRLLIGLFTLLVSTTAMIVAFGATLFLVFCHHLKWMLAVIYVSASIPIAIYFIIQFPLIIDLFSSTYVFKFGKKNIPKGKFNPTDLPFFRK